MSDIKKHQHYEKPSEKKKRKLNAAKRKMRKFQHLRTVIEGWRSFRTEENNIRIRLETRENRTFLFPSYV